eukprot:scaffold59117_cov28-Tisochrysis_lutea.AAC.3
MSRMRRRVSRTSLVAAVTHSRRKSGRDLERAFCRWSSRTSCNTKQTLAPGGALRMYCGLSTKEVCVRSPPALPSFHSPIAAAPQKGNVFDPADAAVSWPARSIDA